MSKMKREEFVEAVEKSDDWMEFEDTLREDNKDDGYVRSFQSWARDDEGKKFALNAHVYDMLPNAPYDTGVDMEVQFNGHVDEKETFEVIKSHHGETPEEAKEWFEEMWNRMECGYYEKYR